MPESKLLCRPCIYLLCFSHYRNHLLSPLYELLVSPTMGSLPYARLSHASSPPRRADEARGVLLYWVRTHAEPFVPARRVIFSMNPYLTSNTGHRSIGTVHSIELVYKVNFNESNTQ